MAQKKPQNVSQRFARAMIELAKEQGALEKTLNELNLIGEALLKVPPLKIILDEKMVSLKEKKTIITELSNALSLSKLTSDFLLYLVDKNRFSLFGYIKQEYQKLFDTLSDLIRATVIIAKSSLADSVRKKIEKILSQTTGMKVICETKIDQSLIGGAVVKIGDLSLDASIAGRLRDMREELI